MHGRGEPLLPVLPDEVVARGAQDVARAASEQAAEGAGQQQRPRPGVHALAGDVDEHDLQPVVGHRADDEVAGERAAAGGAHDGLRVPALGQRRRPALLLEPAAQLDEHRPAGAATQPGLVARAGRLPGEQRRHRATGRTAPGAARLELVAA